MTFEWIKNTAVNAILTDEEVAGKGRVFKCRFLEPGLVKYSFGVCLLTKDVIDKFVQTFVGVPVIIGHQDLTQDTANNERVGVISEVWYAEGWYWAKGIIFDDKAIDLINKNYNISCQYSITEYSNNSEGKLHNANPYDKTILNGLGEHLAIVENPRYENAMIAVNAFITVGEGDKQRQIYIEGVDFANSLLNKVNEKLNLDLDFEFELSDINKYENGKIYIKEDLENENTDFIEYMYEDYKIKPKQAGIKNSNPSAIIYHEIAHGIIYKLNILDEFINTNNNKHGEDDFRQYAGEVSGYIHIFDNTEKECQKEFLCETFADLMVNGEAHNESTKVLYNILKRNKVKNSIIEAINEIKENSMFKNLFKKEEKMDREEIKSIFMECLTELTASNEAEKKEEVKEEVKEEKEEVAENKCKNEEPDYKKMYEELKAEKEAKNEAEKEENEKAKNAILEGEVKVKSTYITERRAIELGKELF